MNSYIEKSFIYIDCELMTLAELQYRRMKPAERAKHTIFDVAMMILRKVQSKTNRYQRNKKIEYTNGVWRIEETFIYSEKKNSLATDGS